MRKGLSSLPHFPRRKCAGRKGNVFSKHFVLKLEIKTSLLLLSYRAIGDPCGASLFFFFLHTGGVWLLFVLPYSFERTLLSTKTCPLLVVGLSHPTPHPPKKGSPEAVKHEGMPSFQGQTPMCVVFWPGWVLGRCVCVTQRISMTRTPLSLGLPGPISLRCLDSLPVLTYLLLDQHHHYVFCLLVAGEQDRNQKSQDFCP